MNREQVLEAIKAHEAKIATERDALCNLYHEIEDLEQCCDDALEGLEQATDALSRYL